MLQKILILIALLFVITSCGEEEKESEIKKSFSTYTVTTWRVASENSYVGYTAWKKEVLLSSKVPWRIVYMRKNVWDSVKKWELLAELDGAEAKVWASNAASIVGSLYGLKKETARSFDGQIKALQSKVDQVQAGITWVKIGLEDVKKITSAQLLTAQSWVAQAKLWLETAKVNLEQTKKDLLSKDDQILAGWKSAILQSVILYKNIIDFSDKFLWITKKNKKLNDKFDDYLWAKDSVQLDNTEKLFLKTSSVFEEYYNYYLEKIEDKNPTKEEIIQWLELAKKTAEAEKVFLKELYTTTDNSIENIYFPIEVINEYKKNISVFGSQVESSLLSVDGGVTVWITGSLENLKSFNTWKDKALALLEKQVELAKSQLNTAEKTYKQYQLTGSSEVNKVQTQKNVSVSQLAEVKAWIQALKAQKQAALKEIDTKIAEANGWKKSAWVMIQNGKIFAPFSWVITSKMWEEWQVTNAWMPLYWIADYSQLKVKISVDFDTYRFLKKWKKVNISLSGTDYKTTGKISLISKTAHKFSKKYDIEVEMKNPKGVIPIGAMVEVWIQIKSGSNKKTIENSLVPNEAIISKFMLPYVFVNKDWIATLIPIKIIKMWEKLSEVSWVKSLDTIIVDWKENLSDGEKLFTNK